MKYIPWLLLFGLIIYTFINKDNKLKQAVLELKTAKTQIDSAIQRIDSSVITLNIVQDSLRSFKLSSDSLYSNFKVTIAKIKQDIIAIKPSIEKLRTTVNAKLKQENKDYKPIVIIQ